MSYRISILRPLHAGGNGDLFIGQRTDTGEHVVVKYLRECHLARARRAFSREVRILRRGLPGLMPVLFADTEGKRPHYVMPYVTGGSLTRYAGRLTNGQLHTVATEVGLALVALHAAFIAHGDVKPDNVLLTGDGHLHVADPLGNGIGCTVMFWESHGGTPGYWAPEVHAGGAISHAGDVYSYGATLYHLLTGVRPLDRQRLDPTSEGYVAAPKIREIIAVCCQVDPKSRPTMTDVLRILRGERWVDIQARRKHLQEQVVNVVAVGGLFLLGGLLAKAFPRGP